MRVSIDGGQNWAEVSEVRIESPENPEADYDMTLVVSSEGLILDQWVKAGDQECLGTACVFWEDVLDVFGVES